MRSQSRINRVDIYIIQLIFHARECECKFRRMQYLESMALFRSRFVAGLLVWAICTRQSWRCWVLCSVDEHEMSCTIFAVDILDNASRIKEDRGSRHRKSSNRISSCQLWRAVVITCCLVYPCRCLSTWSRMNNPWIKRQQFSGTQTCI